MYPTVRRKPQFSLTGTNTEFFIKAWRKNLLTGFFPFMKVLLPSMESRVFTHVFSRTIKDAVCRYRTMQGYRVPRKAGWDTHGLPVEISVEKKLGLKNKAQVEEYGEELFNTEARSLVYHHIDDNREGWGKLTERMGYWVDMDHPYITCENNYIESVWWALKTIFNKGLIYKDYKIVPQDPKSETVLSSHELALGYKEVKDPSVYVKFRVKGAEESFSSGPPRRGPLFPMLHSAVGAGH